MLWSGGSDYKMYVFEESTRRYAVNYKGLREVYTRAQGFTKESFIKAPAVAFYNKLFIK